MKIISLFVTMSAIFINNTFGAENYSVYAQGICEEELDKMTRTGLITLNQRDEWDKEEDNLVSALNEAILNEDQDAINNCTLLLHNYIERFTQLSLQANQLLLKSPEKVYETIPSHTQ